MPFPNDYSANQNGSANFQSCAPSVVKLGDLVRLDISFISFFSRKKKTSSIRPILRAIYLLDDTDRQVSVSDTVQLHLQNRAR